MYVRSPSYLPFFSSSTMFGLPAAAANVGKPVEAGNQPVLDLTGGDLARPPHDARHAETALHDRPLATGERRLTAVGPGEILRTVVRGERQDGVFLETGILELLHDLADDLVELRHPGFVDGPSVLGRSQLIVFLREVGDDVHPRGIEPEKERLTVALRLVDELECVLEDLVVDRLHPLGREWPRVLDLLLADLAPARLDGRVIAVLGPAVQHVAGTDRVLQLRRVVAMERVLHRVQVIEIAEELVEAMHGGQEFVSVAKVVLAELAGGIPQRLEGRGDGRRLRRYADGRAPPGRRSSFPCESVTAP